MTRSSISVGNPEPAPMDAVPVQRAAAPGEARVHHKIYMRTLGLGARRQSFIALVRMQRPALSVVVEISLHDLIENLLMHRRVLDRDQRFDPPIEVTRHPIGRRDEDQGSRRREPMPRPEAYNPGMLQETADDALDGNVFRKALDPGAQAAHSADYQGNRDAGL